MGYQALLSQGDLSPCIKFAKQIHLSYQAIGKVRSMAASSPLVKGVPLPRKENENHRERETGNMSTLLGTLGGYYLPALTSK